MSADTEPDQAERAARLRRLEKWAEALADRDARARASRLEHIFALLRDAQHDIYVALDELVGHPSTVEGRLDDAVQTIERAEAELGELDAERKRMVFKLPLHAEFKAGGRP